MISVRSITRIVVPLAAIAAMLVAPLTPVAASGGGSRCVDFALPVALTPGGVADQRVAGTYCAPARWHGPRTVDVFTPGAGYTSEYWTWSTYRPERYSVVRRTLAAGRATIVYDPLGRARSTKPVSTAVTFATDTHVLDSLVALARLGHRRVNSIGHSYGSAVVIEQAATGRARVDRVVATGFAHGPRNVEVGTRNYPANNEPRFAELDSGYLTSRPGTRMLSFYHEPGVEPGLVAADEATKDTISVTAFGGYVAQQSAAPADNVSRLIRAPVLLLMGQQDSIFCRAPAPHDCTRPQAMREYELAYFPAASRFSVVTVPHTGHSMTGHRSADAGFAALNAFLTGPAWPMS